MRALAPRVGDTYTLTLRDNDSIKAAYGKRPLASAFAADGSFVAPAVKKIRAVGTQAFAALGS